MNVMQITAARFRAAVPYVLSALVLMVVSFYNGYPIHDGDTHSYLEVGFHPMLPGDRSPVYGLFIRLTSMWTSLWFTIFFQSLIVAYVLIRYIKMLAPDAFFNFGWLCLTTIASFTCVSWFCAYLNPHIFAGVLLVAILLYLFDHKASVIQQVIYVLIIVLAISVHNSHFLITGIFSVCIFIYAVVKKYRAWIKKGLVLLSLGCLFYGTMSTINYTHGRGFTVSPSSQVFIMGSFCANGILKEYLDDNCGKKNLRLCAYKDQLPKYPWGFMWPSPQDPLFKVGIWDTCADEFKGIVRDVFTNPKYLRMYAQRAAISTCQELCAIQLIRSGPTIAGDEFKNEGFRNYFGDEYNQFLSSRQNTNQLDTSYFNIAYLLFFILSSIAVLLLYYGSEYKGIFSVYCCIFLFLTINAFVMSSFSAVFEMYQGRVFWVLPATNAILLLKYRWDRARDMHVAKSAGAN